MNINILNCYNINYKIHHYSLAQFIFKQKHSSIAFCHTYLFNSGINQSYEDLFMKDKFKLTTLKHKVVYELKLYQYFQLRRVLTDGNKQ